MILAGAVRNMHRGPETIACMIWVLVPIGFRHRIIEGPKARTLCIFIMDVGANILNNQSSSPRSAWKLVENHRKILA